MKMHIFAIKDLAADVFMTPYFHPNMGAVVRSFGDEVRREAPDNMLNKHPEHFVLYRLGEWDDVTGDMEILETPAQVTLATAYKDAGAAMVARGIANGSITNETFLPKQ